MSYAKHGGDIYTFNNIVDFSANINPYGMPETVKAAIIENIDLYSNYPDPLCRELREHISMFEGINFNNIVCGNGATDLIFRIVLALKPKRALIVQPTFSEYEEALKLVDCKIYNFYLNEENDFKITQDIFFNIPKNIDMVFLCNPNNPTGIPIRKDYLLKFLHLLEPRTYLIVDECFNNFLEEPEFYSMVTYLNRNKNLVVLKAFTKMFAMAGIRLGYALFGDFVTCLKVSKTLQPWSVSTVASKCGVSALKENELVKKTVKIITKNREVLKVELEKFGIKVYDSKVNFLLFKTNDFLLGEKLKKNNILIRNCGNFNGLDKYFYRVAVKTKEENEFLLENINMVMD